MAENDDGQEKKHAPSERKWEQAAEEGNLPRSADIGSAAVVLSGAAALAFGAHIVGQPILEVTGTMLSLGGPAEIDASSAVALMQMGMRAVLLAIALPLGAALVAGVVAGFAQTRGQLATSALTPKPEKLDPIKGFQNLFM